MYTAELYDNAVSEMFWRMYATIWQQSVALFNEFRKQKLINNFSYCQQQHYH